MFLTCLCQCLVATLYRAAVPNLFDTRGWCFYENLMPEDLKWSIGGNCSVEEWLAANTDEALLVAHCSSPSMWSGS